MRDAAHSIQQTLWFFWWNQQKQVRFVSVKAGLPLPSITWYRHVTMLCWARPGRALARRGVFHANDDDTYMTPSDRPDFVALGLKIQWTNVTDVYCPWECLVACRVFSCLDMKSGSFQILDRIRKCEACHTNFRIQILWKSWKFCEHFGVSFSVRKANAQNWLEYLLFQK